MKQTFKLGGTLAAALLLGTMLGGTVSAQTLTMGVRAGPDSIDPHWSTLGSQAETLRHVFDTLVMADENLQLKPGLAMSWKPVDDTTWEFKIREGVKFHDGSELTAEDVKFSIDRIPGRHRPDEHDDLHQAGERGAGHRQVHPACEDQGRGADPAERFHSSLRRVEIDRHGCAQRTVQFRQGRDRHRSLQVRLVGAEG